MRLIDKHTLATVLAATAAALVGGAPSAAAAAPSVTGYGLLWGSQPTEIANGPDGALWFTAPGYNQIGRITTAGTRSTVSIPTGFSNPQGITAGPDGNVWFTEQSGNKIGRLAPGGTTPAEFTVPTASASPYDIAAGPDGNLWFTEHATGKIGRVQPTGTFLTEIATGSSSSQPAGIAAGPDGNLWFTEYAANKIGRVTPSGTLNEFSLATGASPAQIVAGPDGALWFTEYGANKIGRITTAGAVSEFSAPAGSQPDYIAAGPDGNLWFTEHGSGRIGETTPAGAVSDYALQSLSVPLGIAKGADNRLWIADWGSEQILAVALPPAVAPSSTSAVDAADATLSSAVTAYGQATSVHFDYGTTSAYGSQSPAVSVPAGASGQAVSARLSGLAPATTYHYRVVATSVGGTTFGPDSTFTTAAAPPTANPTPPQPTGSIAVAATVYVSPKGVVSFTVACPKSAAGDCRGSIAIMLVRSRTSTHSRLLVAARCGRGCRPLGNGRYRVARGHSGRAQVTLTSWGRHLLAKRGSLPVKVVANMRSGGKSVSSSRLSVLRSARRGHGAKR